MLNVSKWKCISHIKMFSLLYQNLSTNRLQTKNYVRLFSFKVSSLKKGYRTYIRLLFLPKSTRKLKLLANANECDQMFSNLIY